MTSFEFKEMTDKLCNLFAKELNGVQLDFWYKSLKDYDLLSYRRAIGEYAKENKYMPTISDILGYMKKLKPLEQQPKEEQVECKACRGSGYVLYWKDGYQYASLCNCQNAVGKEYNNKETGYYIPKATDIFRIGGTK